MITPQRTKIICTLGPSTEDDDILRELIRSGMTVARLNFSHGTHEYHLANIKRVRRISAELGVPVAIMVDTKGPEIRTRLNKDHEPVLLKMGECVRVSTDAPVSETGCIAIDYPLLPDEVRPGDSIFIDDGLIALAVEECDGNVITCTVVNGGEVGERKGVNVPHVVTKLPAVTEQDRKDIQFACENHCDAVAASFVRDAGAVEEVRALCTQCGAPGMMVVAKIESALAIKNLDEILIASDGVMVARGDLGVEIAPADVPHMQKAIIAKCNSMYRPVITATQMLESMTHHPRPTRAEVTDIANAIEDGTDCVMLSGETAAGEYPVASVRTMSEVCRKAEEYLKERNTYYDRGGMRNVSGATSWAAVETAKLVGAKAIVCPTMSGRTARIMSEFRPRLPIIAVTPQESTMRLTGFLWGVTPVLSQEREGLTKTFYDAMGQVKKSGLVTTNDLVVITAGDPLSSPMMELDEVTHQTSTNVMMVAQVL